MPIATSRTSASTASHRLAIALMNDTLVARNAFDAYLIISADAGSVTSTGACRPRYSSETRTAASGDVHPITIRSGARKSCTAWPSRRNSGFDATVTLSSDAPDSDRTRCTNSRGAHRHGGLVDHDRAGLRAPSRSRRATSSTNVRSAEPSGRSGVCTHSMTISAPRAAAAAPTTKRRRLRREPIGDQLAAAGPRGSGPRPWRAGRRARGRGPRTRRRVRGARGTPPW